MNNILFLALALLLPCVNTVAKQPTNNTQDVDSAEEATGEFEGKKVYQYELDNGLTILIIPDHSYPYVTAMTAYRVGSCNEQEAEKGIAHLLEHMLFKGTNGQRAKSEVDVAAIANKLSGSCNAFTGHDYTAYHFSFPSQQWQHALELLADCMTNARLDEQHLNSELKAVIQELKMHKDNNQASLFWELIGIMFGNHPYHYPLIGYKSDLVNVHHQNLHDFYKKYYQPQNAILIIAGDVKPQEALEKAKEYFGDIKNGTKPSKKTALLTPEISSKAITLYRDIQQPMMALGYLVPGMRDKQDHLSTIAAYILGGSQSSQLYHRLVNELQLAVSVSTDTIDLMEYGIFFIAVEPKDMKDQAAIEKIVNEEIQRIVATGIKKEDITTAVKKTKMLKCNEEENNLSKAKTTMKYFLATNDAEYMETYLTQPIDQLQHETRAFIAEYLRPTVTYKGFLLPLPEKEKARWLTQQEASDAWDQEFLNSRIRTAELEKPARANDIQPVAPKPFNFPKPHVMQLSNGLKVLYYHNAKTPKVNMGLVLAAKEYYDDASKPGLYTFMTAMLGEGTKKYTTQTFAKEIDSNGMSFSANPGSISMATLTEDFKKGLKILTEVLTNATFNAEEVEKVRQQMLIGLKNFWDEPQAFVNQLVQEQLFKDHPFASRFMGTPESINAITRDDLIKFYRQVMTPVEATMAIVGDFDEDTLRQTLEETIGTWKGPKPPKAPLFTPLAPVKTCTIDHPINRDQVVLCYAGRSINRLHPDYDKLFLFDQIFSGSMDSKLFALRQQSGLFYHIDGSLTSGVHKTEPGKVIIQTIVSLDRLKEAQEAITRTIDTVIDSLSEQDLAKAKNAVINQLSTRFSANSNIASIFLTIDYLGLPAHYFDTRAQTLQKITLQEMKDAARKYLQKDMLITLRIGRTCPAK